MARMTRLQKMGRGRYYKPSIENYWYEETFIPLPLAEYAIVFWIDIARADQRGVGLDDEVETFARLNLACLRRTPAVLHPWRGKSQSGPRRKRR